MSRIRGTIKDVSVRLELNDVLALTFRVAEAAYSDTTEERVPEDDQAEVREDHCH